MTWRRLGVLVAHLPRTSAAVRAKHGDAVTWGDTEHLLAAAVDALRVANWQRQGRRNAPRPKPIVRPGDRPSRYGTTHTIADMRRILDNWGRAEPSPSS